VIVRSDVMKSLIYIASPNLSFVNLTTLRMDGNFGCVD
jgi:hypothetical protein